MTRDISLATCFLLGEPDFYGMLFYAVLFFGTLAAAALVIRFIYVKVFRGGPDGLPSINPEGAEGGADERR
jgi:hypothetical protein